MPAEFLSLWPSFLICQQSTFPIVKGSIPLGETFCAKGNDRWRETNIGHTKERQMTSASAQLPRFFWEVVNGLILLLRPLALSAGLSLPLVAVTFPLLSFGRLHLSNSCLETWKDTSEGKSKGNDGQKRCWSYLEKSLAFPLPSDQSLEVEEESKRSRLRPTLCGRDFYENSIIFLGFTLCLSLCPPTKEKKGKDKER